MREQTEKEGLVRDLNPGPLAPKARIIPLDQRADVEAEKFNHYITNKYFSIIGR